MNCMRNLLNSTSKFWNTPNRCLNNNTATMRSTEGDIRGFDKAIVAIGAWTTPSVEGLSGTRSAFVTSGTGYSSRQT